MEDKINLQ